MKSINKMQLTKEDRKIILKEIVTKIIPYLMILFIISFLFGLMAYKKESLIGTSLLILVCGMLLSFGLGIRASKYLVKDLKEGEKIIEERKVTEKIGNNNFGYNGNLLMDGANALKGKNLHLNAFEIATDRGSLNVNLEMFNSTRVGDIIIIEKLRNSGIIIKIDTKVLNEAYDSQRAL